MKNYIVFGMLCLIMAISLKAQQPQDPAVITRPDLSGSIRQNGTNLIIRVENTDIPQTNNGSGNAPKSKAELKMGTQTQTIQVPELAREAVFEKTVPIPTNLLNQSFTATLKVDAPNAINEISENNNLFTKIFNECDLVVVKNGPNLEMSWDGKNKPGIYSFKVKNDGTRKTPASGARVLVNEPGKPSSTQFVTIPAINPGATVNIAFKFGGKICNTYFQVDCDPNNTLKESNEGNNMAYIKPTCED